MHVYPDPCPELPIERGPKEKGVGPWVPQDKHHYLSEYLHASRHAWKGWPQRVFIDPFCATGRIQVQGESHTRDGGAVVAWRKSLEGGAPFTAMFVGDIDPARANACAARLQALGAPAVAFPGPAEQTVVEMTARVPRGALCLAYVDPYSLELLTYSIIETLSKLRKVDLATNFCMMDLTRNSELEFSPTRLRFDGTAPGWRTHPPVLAANKHNVRVEFFNYWKGLVEGLQFQYSQAMPIVRNREGKAIYRMVFFARHDLPIRIWGDIARGPTKPLFDDF